MNELLAPSMEKDFYCHQVSFSGCSKESIGANTSINLG
jgi:hypothetical protein